MKVAIGCDEAGFLMKEALSAFLSETRAEVIDLGCHDLAPVLYPDIALQVAQSVRDGEAKRGILICGTGIGMAISANKVRGIRAAVCHELLSTERSILSNDVQIMCLGARVIAPELALLLVKRWLELEFVDGPSSEKVQRIREIESGL